MPDEPTTKPVTVQPPPPFGSREWRPDDGGRRAQALRVLRAATSRRPPLYAPVSDNALAAATAAVIELRSRIQPLGERERDRPAKDVAREVSSAAAPFIQRDVLSRVLSDRLWMFGWVSITAGVVTAAMLVVLVYALVERVTWLGGVAGFAIAVQVLATVQILGSMRRESARARVLRDRPLTGPVLPSDETAETVDITTAAAAAAAQTKEKAS